jgi:thioredoxin 1
MKTLVIIALLIIAAFAAGQLTTTVITRNSQPSFRHLTPEKFNSELSSGQYTLLDVRTREEYLTGHLKNAIQTDYYQTQNFSDYLDTLDKNNKYLIYCRTGVRSGKAMQIMQDKGFKNVSDLDGGYNAWVANNLSVEK